MKKIQVIIMIFILVFSFLRTTPVGASEENDKKIIYESIMNVYCNENEWDISIAYSLYLVEQATPPEPPVCFNEWCLIDYGN